MRIVARCMLWLLLAVFGLISIGALVQPRAVGAQSGAATPVEGTSIGGTVLNTATSKPEAGVWVIAETKLAVPYRKIVATNDQGRFLIPDLPVASYDLWVRGYGLKDSGKTKAERGSQVKLQVSNAASPQEAAKIFDPKKETWTVSDSRTRWRTR